jgi:PHP domain
MPTLRGHWKAADRAEAYYRYVPFTVPAGARGLQARLSYQQGPAVLDLGLLDPSGFRGWSGGARDGFALTPAAATPGYLPGPLPAGEWQAMLGLYRVPEDGVDWTLEIEIGAVSPPQPPPPGPLPARPPRRALPASAGRRWLAGDLHSHTVHSDGTLHVDELARVARGQGLDFLAVTDHNTISHHAELSATSRRTGVLLLPGQEVTTPDGHAGAIGTSRWVDFRQPPETWRAAGGLLCVNHPTDAGCGWRLPLSERMHLVEAWHGSWDRNWPDQESWQALIGAQPEAGVGAEEGDDPASTWWRRFGAVPVGGSDFHRFDGALPGRPTTWVEVEGDDVLGALRAGRVALSANPSGAVLVRHDGEIVACDAEGATLLAPDRPPVTVATGRDRLPATGGPYRLADPEGRILAILP